MEHPKFRAAFDLLELRANVEHRNELQELALWWTDFQQANNIKQREMISELGSALLAAAIARSSQVEPARAGRISHNR